RGRRRRWPRRCTWRTSGAAAGRRNSATHCCTGAGGRAAGRSGGRAAWPTTPLQRPHRPRTLPGMLCARSNVTVEVHMLPDVLTAAALLGLVQAHGAAPPLDRIMAAAALTEAPARDARGAVVGATRLARGDGGRSLGPWQIHDIHGLTAAQRTDWHFAAAWMLHEEFQPAYDRLLARGGGALPAEERATYVYMAAERPAGWRGWSAPGLHSAAAEAFRANWQAVQDLAPEEIAVSAMERWIARLYAYAGTPYVFGGKDVARDGGLDCSGLLTRAARDCGLDLGDPDTTSADALKAVGPQLDGGLPIDEAAAQRGDLVLFHSTYGSGGPTYATHVGVWVRPGVMFDTHDGAHETRFNDGGGYWTQHYLGLWRNTAIP